MEHPLSKREVVGSNPTGGCLTDLKRGKLAVADCAHLMLVTQLHNGGEALSDSVRTTWVCDCGMGIWAYHR